MRKDDVAPRPAPARRPGHWTEARSGRAQARGAAQELPGAAEAVVQVRRQRLASPRFGGVVPGIERVHPELHGVVEGVVRPFARQEGIEAERRGLRNEIRGRTGDHSDPVHMPGPARNETDRPPNHLLPIPRQRRPPPTDFGPSVVP